MSAQAIRSLRILRKSLDVRDRSRPEFVYTVAVELNDAPFLNRPLPTGVTRFAPVPFEEPIPGKEPLDHPPVVIGAGPAGLFAAYLLAKFGYQPILLERGTEVRDRIKDIRDFDRGGPLDPESNYLFGEGGAGTFSDGKFTCRNTGPDTDAVLKIFADLAHHPPLTYEHRPHLGSNRLPGVVKALRRQTIELGGTVHFRTRVDDLIIENGAVDRVQTGAQSISANVVVLAIGHSARDTYAMLLGRGVPIRPKPFQMGVRIEQPQAQINRARYGNGPAVHLLGAADYTLNCHVGDRDLFTFCMCAGGFVMPSVSQPGHFCTNGMSRSRHDSPFANSGLVVTIDPMELGSGWGSDPLVGLRWQASIERSASWASANRYLAPIQWASDFLDQRPTRDRPPSSYERGTISANLWDFLPTPVAEAVRVGLPTLNDRLRGALLHDATLVGPEARGSCPVRIPRFMETRESVGVAGLYPVGEGAGYAGGIVSAAVDGFRSARAIINRYRPLKK